MSDSMISPAAVAPASSSSSPDETLVAPANLTTAKSATRIATEAIPTTAMPLATEAVTTTAQATPLATEAVPSTSSTDVPIPGAAEATLPPTTTTVPQPRAANLPPVAVRSLSARIAAWAAPPVPLVALVGSQHVHAQLLECDAPQRLKFISLSASHRFPAPKRLGGTSTRDRSPSGSEAAAAAESPTPIGDPLLAPPPVAPTSPPSPPVTNSRRRGVPGMLKEYWLEKRTRLLPAVCILALEWPASQSWAQMAVMVRDRVEQVLEGTGAGLFNGRKARIGLVGLLMRAANAPPLTPADIPKGNGNSGGDLNMALAKLGKRVGLGSGHQRLFVWQQNGTKSAAALKSLHVFFYKDALEVYKAEFKRLRIAKRPDASRDAARDDVRRLSIRQNFKIGFYAELMGDTVQALKYFRSAYSLVAQMFLRLAAGSSSVDALYEARAVACVLHRKIARILLLSGHTPEARAHFEQHIATFFPPHLPTPPVLCFARLDWLADEYAVFAHSLESVITPKSDAELRRSVAYFLQSAAAHVLQWRRLYQEALQNRDIRTLEFLLPIFLGQLPSAPVASGKTTDALVAAIVWREAGMDHTKRAIQLLSKAYEQFKHVRANRMIVRVASQMSAEYFAAGDFAMAKRFCDRIAKTFAGEQWWRILAAILVRALTCAEKLEMERDAMGYRWELLGHHMEGLGPPPSTLLAGLVAGFASLQGDVLKLGVSREHGLVTAMARVVSVGVESKREVQMGHDFLVDLRLLSRVGVPLDLSFVSVTCEDARYSLRLHGGGDGDLDSSRVYEVCADKDGNVAVPVRALVVQPGVTYQFRIRVTAHHLTTREAPIAMEHVVWGVLAMGNSARGDTSRLELTCECDGGSGEDAGLEESRDELRVVASRPAAYADVTHAAPCLVHELYPLLLTVHSMADEMKNIEVEVTIADVDVEADGNTVDGACVYFCESLDKVHNQVSADAACALMKCVAQSQGENKGESFSMPDAPPKAARPLHLFLRAPTVGTRTLSVHIRYTNAMEVRVAYVSNFSVQVVVPFKLELVALQRCASTAYLSGALGGTDVLMQGETGVFFVNLTNVCPRAVTVDALTLQLDAALFSLVGKNDDVSEERKPVAVTLQTEDRYSDSFGVIAKMSGAQSPGNMIVTWRRRHVETAATPASAQGSALTTPPPRPQTRIRGYTVSRQPDDMSSLLLDQDQSAPLMESDEDSGDEAKAWPLAREARSGGVATALALPTDFAIPLGVLQVARVRTSVQVQHVSECVLGETVEVRATLTNASNAMQDVRFEVTGGGGTAATPYAMSGPTSGRVRLLPRAHQEVVLGVVPLECGPLALPRIQFRAAVDGRLLNDESDFGSVFVRPRPLEV